MKNLFKVFVLILSFSQVLTAQDSTFGSDIKFGAKAGLNLATITGDLEDIKGRTSFHIGGMAEIMISDDFAIQPELLYSAQGASSSGFTLALDYIYAPIMAKYFVDENLSFEAGPQFGYLLSAKLKDGSSDDGGGGGITVDENARTSSNASVQKASQDVKDDVKNFDYGLSFGANYLLDSGINFSARYYLGLANGNNFEDNDGDFKNSVIQISVGYFFN